MILNHGLPVLLNFLSFRLLPLVLLFFGTASSELLSSVLQEYNCPCCLSNKLSDELLSLSLLSGLDLLSYFFLPKTYVGGASLPTKIENVRKLIW